MVHTLKITPAAFSDIQNGIDYYQSQQKGLGDRFASSVQITLNKIASLPHSASTAYSDVRYKRILKFPYVILYIIDNLEVYILRVFNTYQKPTFES